MEKWIRGWHKQCSSCGDVKSIEEFSNAKRSKDGLSSACKVCDAEYHRKRYIENREEILERNRKWAEENGEKSRNKPISIMRRKLLDSKSKAHRCGYVSCNATAEELLATFTGFCYICGASEIDCTKRLSMDHCHETGNFRGWLCGSCNRAIGFLGESIENALKLVEYLRITGTNTDA